MSEQEEETALKSQEIETRLSQLRKMDKKKTPPRIIPLNGNKNPMIPYSQLQKRNCTNQKT